jgi:MFS family permease
MVLTSLASRDTYGRAFGVERAGDNAGAILGPLLAAGTVAWIGIRHAILLSFIPGVLAAAAITFAARQARAVMSEKVAQRTLALNLRALRDAGLVRTLTPVALFEFGNVATTLLILRATDLLHTGSRSLTAATSVAILLYVGYNSAAALTSIAAGHLADRVSARVTFAGGAVAYVGGYVIFGFGPHGWVLLLLAFAACGVGIGLAETAESTVVARALPDRLRGNGFGVLGLTQAVGDLASTVVAGALWAAFSPALAFAYAAAWMAASIFASGLLGRRARPDTDAAISR